VDAALSKFPWYLFIMAQAALAAAPHQWFLPEPCPTASTVASSPAGLWNM
jgi:hypothetical protein